MSSKYALDSEYTRVLNMLLVLNMPGSSIYQGPKNVSSYKYAVVLNITRLLIYL